MHLLQQAFCVFAFLTINFPLTAQQALWTHNHSEPSRVFGFVQLENDNALLASQFQDTLQFSEVDPEDGSQLSLKTFTLAEPMVYVEQYASDTLLTLSENGFLWTLDRNGDTLTKVAQIFPELAASDNYFRVYRGERIGDTLFAYAKASSSAHIWYARVVYDGGIVSSTATNPGGRVRSRWHSEDGLQAYTNAPFRDEPVTLTVNDATGAETLSITLSESVVGINKVLFYQPNRIYALTYEYNGQFGLSNLLDINLTTGTYETISFPSPNPVLGVSFLNMRLIGDDLLLVGLIGRGNPHTHIAYSFNADTDEMWQFYPPGNLGFGSFTDVIPSPIIPNEYLFSGNVGLDDVGITGNAFIMSGKLIKTSTRDVQVLPLRISPNPVTDRLQLTGLNKAPELLRVFDQTGRMVIEAANQRDLMLSTLPQGIYFLSATDGQRVFTGKFVKR